MASSARHFVCEIHSCPFMQLSCVHLHCRIVFCCNENSTIYLSILLWCIFGLWQVVFSKDDHRHISQHMCSSYKVTLTFLPLGHGVSVPPFESVWAFALPLPIDCGEKNFLSHFIKYALDICYLVLLGYLPWEPSHHAVRKAKLPQREAAFRCFWPIAPAEFLPIAGINSQMHE